MMTTLTSLHPAVSSLALFQSTQLNLFEQFLSQAVSGIDSTSITAGMQNVGYVILLVGFLWQVYQSALHGGDVRGLATNLIKYVTTAIVVMNYHAVFTTINQGFVNAGNWISSASGAQNLFDNWQSDLQSQYSQIGFQNMWGLITGSLAGLLDALLILVAYLLYPIVIVIFGFFYIFYGSVFYIFGPIVIALMPLSATNRLAKAYAENVFIWNAWPILYGGFGSLLSAVQMGQVGQMLSQNNFLGGLGNLEGSVLIGIASIIYSLAIAVIPFIAKRIVSGDVGATAAALIGAAGTALTAGIAAGEGAIAGVAAGRASLPTGGLASEQNATASSGLSATTAKTMAGSPGNQPAPQQRSSSTVSGGTTATTASTTRSNQPSASTIGTVSSTQTSPTSMGEEHAERMRVAAGKPSDESKATNSPGRTQPSSPSTGSPSQASVVTGAAAPRQGSFKGSSSSGHRPSIAPYRLSTWGAYHLARFAASSAIQGGHSAMRTAGSISDAIAHPVETASRVGSSTGDIAGGFVNATARTGSAAAAVVRAVTRPGREQAGDSVSAAAEGVVDTTRKSVSEARTGFINSYQKKRDEND